LLLAAACQRGRHHLPPAPAAIAAGPWLLDPGEAEMTVAWLTDAPSAGRVFYGPAQPALEAKEPGGDVREHRVTLTGLRPATKYLYRVEGAAETGSFVTAPGDQEPFDVLIYGDNRSNNGDHALVARAAAAERAPVALHTGDMVVDARDDGLWRIWFDEERDLLAHSALVATVGNHEITDSGTAYSRFFQHRGRPAYWSIDYGPVHLDVLDSFEVAAGATPHSSGVSDAQRQWLVEDVKSVPKDRSIWVLVHQGPYSHPDKPRPGHGGSVPVLQALAAAREQHPIAAVFAGHEHFYQRGETDGLKWFVLGGGGAPLDDPGSGPDVRASARALSYAMIHVCGCHASGEVKDVAGRILDSFVVSDCAVPCRGGTRPRDGGAR
jgi:hypothetical protein